MRDKEQTLTYIKPDAMEHLDDILNHILKSGFDIIFVSEPIQLTREQAETFYAEHKGKSFFENLVQHTISGPIVVAMLEKHNAIKDFRTCIGDADPAKAEIGTIRNLYGNPELYAQGIPANAIHGSDSPERVRIEAAVLIPEFEFEV